MARILFTWELGGGMGHSLCHRPLLNALIAAGHDVWFAMRSVEDAETIFAGMDIHLLQAPAVEFTGMPRCRHHYHQDLL